MTTPTMPAEQPESVVVREAVEWHRTADITPEPGHKFVGLYSDGSGAWLGFAHDGGFIDSNGDDYKRMNNAEWWAYLPSGFELHCESHPEEEFNLPKHVCPPLAAAPRQPQGAEVVAWRDVVGFEDYEVSSHGDVRRKGSSKPLAKPLAGMGYQKCELWINNTRKQTYVHRVVAEAFLSNPLSAPEVNHKDGDKTNNRVENLEWVTRSENQNHAYYALGQKVRAVIGRDANTGSEQWFPSMEEAARQVGGTSKRISYCVNKGPDKLHCGRTWRAAPDATPQPEQPAPVGRGTLLTILRDHVYLQRIDTDCRVVGHESAADRILAALSQPAPEAGEVDRAMFDEAIRHLKAMSHVAPRTHEVNDAHAFLAALSPVAGGGEK